MCFLFLVSYRSTMWNPHDTENGQEENVFQSENVTLKWKHKRVEWNEYNVFICVTTWRLQLIHPNKQLYICIGI